MKGGVLDLFWKKGFDAGKERVHVEAEEKEEKEKDKLGDSD
jgi:hypothetical protein